MLLTSDSKRVLFILYKEYKRRRKYGDSRAKAKLFRPLSDVKAFFFPRVPIEDLIDSLTELGNIGFVVNVFGSDTIYCFELTNEGLATLEDYPKDVFNSVTDFIAKFIP
jgi:hypothetical protein